MAVVAARVRRMEAAGLENAMDAVFITPLPGGTGINEATVEPPLSLAYLASMLEKHGFACAIIDANALGMSFERTVKAIPEDARLIGFYLNSYGYNAVRDLAAWCRKERPNATVVIGGPTPSAVPAQVIEDIPCHGVVCGEGEYAVLRIMQNISAGRPAFDAETPGAAYRATESGAVRQNPVRRVEDLDELPFPAYHLLPPMAAYRSRCRKSPVAAIVTSRGCPHECSFCSKDVFERKVTFRSAANVLAEIDELHQRWGARQIDVLDDNFAQKRSRLDEILDGLIERDYGLALNLQSGVRTEILDPPLLAKMRRAGFYKLAFGIESADPEVLRLCRKRLDLARAEEAIRAAKKAGFLVYGFFVIGLPGETDEGFRRTLDFAKRMDFYVANFCMAVPFVGTELYDMIKARGRFLIDTSRNIDAGFYAGRPFYELDGLTGDDALRRYRTAYREFYTLRRKLRMIAGIRSWQELRWSVNAAKTILKGMGG
jgi:anaerobic magnesium-protoporphyrin IX monomethyl ester cyclase